MVFVMVEGGAISLKRRPFENFFFWLKNVTVGRSLDGLVRLSVGKSISLRTKGFKGDPREASLKNECSRDMCLLSWNIGQYDDSATQLEENFGGSVKLGFEICGDVI